MSIDSDFEGQKKGKAPWSFPLFLAFKIAADAYSDEARDTYSKKATEAERVRGRKPSKG